MSPLKGSHLQVLFARRLLRDSMAFRSSSSKIGASSSFLHFAIFLLSSSQSVFVSVIRNWKLDPDATMLRSVEVALQGFSRLILRSCPYSASPVATGHPEELHDQEQFRVLVSAILLFEYSDFVLVSSYSTYHFLYFIYLFLSLLGNYNLFLFRFIFFVHAFPSHPFLST